ncbi:MAG TPA: GtrA family protein [Steroidobacteraceae bacterium]|nr:GtrA family protein [Steroidobacteraceae bacterium]
MRISSTPGAFREERLLKLARFSGVGVTCFGLGLAILVGLHELAGVNYLLAYVASFVATNITGYLLNARFTFRPESVNHLGAIRYMAVNAVLLVANTVALKLLVDLMHMWYLLAAIILAAVNMPVSFIGQWLFTYRTDSQDRSATA